MNNTQKKIAAGALLLVGAMWWCGPFRLAQSRENSCVTYWLGTEITRRTKDGGKITPLIRSYAYAMARERCALN